MKKIVLAGGTGHLGSLLQTHFLQKGWEVIVISRSEQISSDPSLRFVQWDGRTLGEWVDYLEKSDVLINLSGKNISTRFTSENKKALTDSRILPTRIIGEAISSLKNPPQVWINFTGISIFEGMKGRLRDENDKDYGHTFLAKLTQQWEEALWAKDLVNTKKIALRISPVLSKDFGIFSELYPLTKLGLGGKVANGQQLLPWIHEDDLVGIVNWVIEQDNPRTIYHACSPNTVSNEEFMKALRMASGMKFGMPLPKLFASIGAFFKGVDSSLLLASTPTTTKYLIEEGYAFKFSYLHRAFEDLIKTTK